MPALIEIKDTLLLSTTKNDAKKRKSSKLSLSPLKLGTWIKTRCNLNSAIEFGP